MQLSNPHQLTDCISAKQLLQALTTLQQMSTDTNNEVQLSFSQESYSFFNTVNNQSKMDFQLYMALKKESKKNQLHKNKKNIQKKLDNEESRFNKHSTKLQPQKTYIRKTLPGNQKQKLTQKSVVKTKANQSLSRSKEKSSQIQRIKSRSHSPLQNLTKKQNIPKLTTNSTQITSSHLYKEKKTKENQQNIPLPHQSNISNVKISQASKKILVERQRKGKVYVPIQNRTNQLIKQKQEKIAKLQRANLAQKQFEQRECTFKPSINSFRKPAKNQSHLIQNRHRTHTNIDSVQDQYNSIQDIKMCKNLEDEEKLQKKQKVISTIIPEQINKLVQDNHTNNGQQVVVNTQTWNEKRREQPKNQKFNILLDLIN